MGNEKLGPSQHLTWSELACVNRLGRKFSVGGKNLAPGEIVAKYPVEWRDNRAVTLAFTFETIRWELGGVPMTINSAYRCLEYNRAVGSTDNSQHPAGRALDITHKTLNPRELHAQILRLYAERKLSELGGLGKYPGFVHIDVRPQPHGRLATW